MSEHAFSLTAGIVFLLIALGHLARIIMGLPAIVQGVSIPAWASVVALVVTTVLSYEGFHLATEGAAEALSDLLSRQGATAGN